MVVIANFRFVGRVLNGRFPGTIRCCLLFPNDSLAQLGGRTLGSATGRLVDTSLDRTRRVLGGPIVNLTMSPGRRRVCSVECSGLVGVGQFCGHKMCYFVNLHFLALALSCRGRLVAGIGPGKVALFNGISSQRVRKFALISPNCRSIVSRSSL